MMLTVLVVVSCVSTFALGVWQGWILRRPPPRQPLLRIPRFGHATLTISPECIVELGAVDARGTFVIHMAPHTKEVTELPVVIGDS